MTTLSGAQRAQLERSILRARAAAEAGIGKLCGRLGVIETTAPAGILDDDRVMRTALRRRARDLGQGRVDANARGDSAIGKGLPFLIEELVYERWHRLFFARLLAENGLLVHPELGPISLDDVRDLAAEEGLDPWELAADFAADRLPGLFHLSVPLRLAPEDRQSLATIISGMDASLFTSSDALGWSYQFWQARRKKEINDAGKKIGGSELPPVTQLFTEDYIVQFLLENTLGAWFVSRYPDTRLVEDWTFLRYREDGMPAAGTFPTWPDAVRDVTILDPCCGSGHFLIAAFHMLVAMRQEVEHLAPDEAADAVLRDNLFGLELDARCTQIATFALALEAWKLGGHPERHLPHIACSGVPVSGQKDAWRLLAGGNDNIRIALDQLHDVFAQAPELGSLIDPRQAAHMGPVGRRGQRAVVLAHEWDTIERKLHQALARERASDPAAAVFADDPLTGTLRAAQLLSRTYTLVATNVPYLSRGSHSDVLKTFADRTFPEAKNDLATIFLERCLRFVVPGDGADANPTGAGTVAAVTPQNWLFLGAYRALREHLLAVATIDVIARLGARAFRTISGEVVNVALPILTNTSPRLDHAFAGLDASVAPTPDAKAAVLQDGVFTLFAQAAQHRNPDSQLMLVNAPSETQLLNMYALSLGGITTGDSARFRRAFWELQSIDKGWKKQQTAPLRTVPFAGREHVVFWQDGNGEVADSAVKGRATIAGRQAWNKLVISVQYTGALNVTLYEGDIYENVCAVIVPNQPSSQAAVWSFCQSDDFRAEVRKVDSKLGVTCNTLAKIPFDLAHWQGVADVKYPDGLPEPYSSDPTQWLFDGTVPDSDHPLQVAVARLVGYSWPEQAEDGLAALADPDGIVCLPSVNREPQAHIRLRALLERAYGDAWSEAVLAGLLRDAGAPSLDAWLRSKRGFFEQHTKLFHHRLFIWHLTDGHREGFSALVNYHRLNAQTLSKLIYTYLNDWIDRQRRAVAAEEPGAQGRLEAADTLRQKLIAIAEGEPPYDIYVRWKSLAELSIGWQPDLNDGVRMNIRPFVEAGVLAAKVNVKWGKDRGADPVVRDEPLLAQANSRDPTDLRDRVERHASTDRHNDLHFSNDEKRQARDLVKSPPDP